MPLLFLGGCAGSDPSEARRLVAGALPPLVASLLEPQEIESLKGKLTKIPESTVWPRLAKEDWFGSLGVFLLVFLSLFPVVVPFIFIAMPDWRSAFLTGLLFCCCFWRAIHSAALRIAIPGERGSPWSSSGPR